MATTKLSAIANRRTISIEEYTRLKRRLLHLRGRYTKLLHAIGEYGMLTARQRQLELLERRMAKLELTLALSSVAVPDDRLLSLDEIIQHGRAAWAGIWQKFAIWRAALREYWLARSRTHPHRKIA